MSVREKLLIVQSKLNAPKSQVNKFGGYKYRSNEDILNAVKPLLSEVKAIITQSDEIVQIGERYYIKVTSSFIDVEPLEKDINVISNTAYAREAENKKGMDEAQITGSASSYARKYSLNGLLAIDDSKDPDVTNKHGKDDKKQDKATPMYVEKDDCINAQQMATIDTVLTDKKIGLLSFLKSYNKHFKTDIKTINEIVPKNYDEVLELLGV